MLQTNIVDLLSCIYTATDVSSIGVLCEEHISSESIGLEHLIGAPILYLYIQSLYPATNL